MPRFITKAALTIAALTISSFTVSLILLCSLPTSSVSSTSSAFILGNSQSMKRKTEPPAAGGIIDLTGDSPSPKRSAVDRNLPPTSRSTNKRQPVEEVTSVTLATYNIWFGPHSGPLHDEERMNSIVAELLQRSPSLIGLQEVTPDLAAILCPLLESAGYQVVLQDTRGIGYGCAVAAKADEVIASGFHPYEDTSMGRGIVWCLVRIQSKEVLFTTTHLESFIKGGSYDGVSQRSNQARQLAEFCQECLEQRPSTMMAVITGDLNWDDQRVRGGGIDAPLLGTIDKKRWLDVWQIAHPRDAGYTYDGKESPMLRGNLRRRFDRCLIHSRNAVSVESALMIGKDAIPNLTWTKPPHPMARSQKPTTVPVTPSDHFGLVATVKV